MYTLFSLEIDVKIVPEKTIDTLFKIIRASDAENFQDAVFR
jgi:hypothetical protein